MRILRPVVFIVSSQGATGKYCPGNGNFEKRNRKQRIKNGPCLLKMIPVKRIVKAKPGAITMNERELSFTTVSRMKSIVWNDIN